MTNSVSVQKSFYTFVGLMTALSFSVQNALAAGMNVHKNDPSKISGMEGNTANDMEEVANNVVNYIIGLLYFVAVLYTLWGGFQILTAGGDDDKVKKGKSTIIRGVIGLVIIFLASTLVKWIISLFSGGQATTGQ